MVKIMPVGTSLTEVTWNEGGTTVAVLGYKGIVFNTLQDQGYDIDYVGSRLAPATSGVRDRNHEAISGSIVNDHVATMGARVTTYTPDILLVELGANDAWWNTDTTAGVLAKYRTLLTNAFAAKSDLKAILCKIAPLTPSGYPNAPSRRLALNTGIEAEAAYWVGEGKDVVVADFGNPAPQSDGVHWVWPTGHQTAASNLLPTVKAMLDGVEPGQPATGTWLSGAAANTGSPAGANGTWESWVGGSYKAEIGHTWDDSSPAVQEAQWSTSPGGPWGSWRGAMSVAVGAIFKPLGESWAAAATGSYDARWTTMLQNLASNRGSKGTTYIAFGHEANYSGSPWSVGSSEVANYKTAFQRFRALQLAHFPAAKLVWPMNDGTHTGVDVRDMMPGATYFDVVGVDSYNSYPALNSASALTTRFARTETSGAPVGLEAWRLYAVSLGKKLAIPEWGTDGDPNSESSGQDSPVFMEFWFQWIASHAEDIEYETYFNISSFQNNRYGLYPSTKSPLAAARYRNLFSTKESGTAPPPIEPPPPATGTGEALYSNDGTATTGLAAGLSNGGATIVPTSGQLRLTTGSGMYGAGQISRYATIATPRADVRECMTYTPRDNNAQEMWLAVRAETGLDGQRGYWLRVDPNADQWYLYSTATHPGSGTSLGSGTITFGSGVPVHACLEAEGNKIRARVYSGDTEPAAWNVEATDTKWPEAGVNGFMFRSGTAGSIADIDNLTISTAGTVTPSEPVPVAGEWKSSNTLFGVYGLATAVESDPSRLLGGVASTKVTWPAKTTAYGSWIHTTNLLPNLVPGSRYRATVPVYVPTGSPRIRLNAAFMAVSTWSEVKDTNHELSVDFVPDGTIAVMLGVDTDSPTEGSNAWVGPLKISLVEAGTNQPPWINPGPSLIVSPGKEFTLTGWEAGDPERGPYTVTWESPGLPLIRGGGTLSPTFLAPRVDSPTRYMPKVTVTDQVGETSEAFADITVGGQARLVRVLPDGRRRVHYMHRRK